MRLTGSRAYTRPTPTPKMPAGLVELMEGLTKDVLKNNPVDLYEFCAGHMQTLIDIRDGNLPKKQKISLDEKIKRAQEKVRQRIRDRLLQRDDISISRPATEKTNDGNPSNGTQNQSVMGATETEPEAPIPPENTDVPKQPFHNGEDSKIPEVKTFIEPNAVTANIVHEQLIDTRESVQISTETEENKEKEVVKETKESCSDDKEDSPMKSDKLHVEEFTKEIETDVKNVNSETKEVSITSETVHCDGLTEVNASQKPIENVKPISSETNPIENTADKTTETTMVQSKQLSEVKHGSPDSSNDDKFTQSTQNILPETPIQLVASNVNDILEKHNKPEIDTAKESKEPEKILSTEFQCIEIVKNPIEENYIHTVHKAVEPESITSPKPTQIDDDVSKKDGHDVKKEKNMNEVQLAGQNTTDVNSETKLSEASNDYKDGSKDKNTGEENYGDESQDGTRLKHKTVEMNSSSKTGNSEMSTNKDTSCQDVKENENLNIKKVENRTVAGTTENLENLKIAAGFENDHNNKVEGNVMKKVGNATVAETVETVEHLKSAASFENRPNKNESHIVEGNQMMKVDNTTVAETTENLENLKRAAGFENDQNKKESPVVEGNAMNQVGKATVAKTVETGEHLKSAASFENGHNKNESHEVERNVMKEVENATVAETVENVEHLKRTASFENGQNNNGLSLVEVNVVKKVEYAIVAETSENLETLKSAAGFENDQNKNELPVLKGTVMKKIENATVAETIEKLERVKSATTSENGQDKNKFPEVEGNVIDTAREFLEHERQLSSGLATEVSKVVSEKSTLEKNLTGERDATIEPNSAGTGMDLETAAVTIQKVFRTFLFSKSRTSTLEDGVNENSLDDDTDKKGETEFISSANLNKERRSLGISRMDTVLQTVNEEKSLSLSTDDSSTLSSAATTIQAHVRGFLVRNRLSSYKTTSNSSLLNSEGASTVSLDGEVNEPKKTILNIHIVPDRGQFMSRDESILTSIDLPLDNSPPSSVNLHPLGYDKSEPRKQLKREDAIQSVSPPSNNSGKLSEEVDSVKETENNIESKLESENIEIPPNATEQRQEDAESCDTTLTISSTAETVVDAEIYNTREVPPSPEHNYDVDIKSKEAASLSSDEMDVVTPFPSTEKTTSSPDIESNEKPKLIHTGEFHDMVIQTPVKRRESSVVREFKNVLVYFLIWDKT